MEALMGLLSVEDAFLREVQLVSPTYVREADGEVRMVAAESRAGMRMLVSAPDRTSPGVELFFEEVEEVTLRFSVDLQPEGRVQRDRIELSLSPGARVVARRASFRAVGVESWGRDVRYGVANLFDEGGFPVPNR